jgi:hypothetical protein
MTSAYHPVIPSSRHPPGDPPTLPMSSACHVAPIPRARQTFVRSPSISADLSALFIAWRRERRILLDGESPRSSEIRDPKQSFFRISIFGFRISPRSIRGRPVRCGSQGRRCGQLPSMPWNRGDLTMWLRQVFAGVALAALLSSSGCCWCHHCHRHAYRVQDGEVAGCGCGCGAPIPAPAPGPVIVGPSGPPSVIMPPASPR